MWWELKNVRIARIWDIPGHFKFWTSQPEDEFKQIVVVEENGDVARTKSMRLKST